MTNRRKILLNAISVILCFVLAAGSFALDAAKVPFALKAEAASADVSRAVNPAGSVPDGFDSVRDPYQLMGTDDVRHLATLHELMFSGIDPAGSGNTFAYRIGNNLKSDTITGDEEFNMDGDSAYFESTDGAEGAIAGIYFMQSAALDSDGDGTRESVIYVGYRASDEKIVAWSVNTKAKTTSEIVSLGSAADGVEDLYSSRMPATYQALNFFSVAAGDFNGDGKEVVFAALPFGAGDDETPKLVELSAADGSVSVVSSGFTEFFNQAFFDDDIGIYESGDYEDLLSTRITSGDFNNDGKTDLAVLSYTNNISGSYDDEDYRDLYTPRLIIGYGSDSGLSGFRDASNKAWVEKKDYEKSDDDESYYDVPIAGNLIGADIDNDGCDEIVIAGYSGQVYGDDVDDDDPEYYLLDSARTASKLIYVTYDADNGLNRKSWEQKESNKWTSTTGEATTGVWLSQDWVWQPIGMGKAAFDGKENADYVFISGTVYQFLGGTLNELYTPDYFCAQDQANDGATISVTFISSTASGVFDGNYRGQEQLAYTVGLKVSSSSTYHYLVGVLGKTDVKNGDHVTRQWYNNNIEDSKTYSGSQYAACVNAVDSDDDIVTVRYGGKAYGWSDPEIIGVLQAAPYFGELGSYESFNDGATTLTLSTSYESEYAETASQSLGVGGMFELDTELFEMEIKAGYAGEWEQTTFSTESRSQAFSVTAGPNDTVIIKRTPVYDFAYDLWDAQSGTWITDGYHINVVKESQYYSFSVDEYNTFARLYNELMAENYEDQFKPFKEITSENAPYLMGNEGNPYAYLQGSIGAMNTSIAHNGGSKSISYENAYGSGSSTSKEEGFSFEFQACGGPDVVKFGGYLTTDFMWGYEKTSTTVSGTGTEGEVANINDADIAEETGSPEDLVHQYGFTWSFGTWGLNLFGEENVPVYGYYVSGISGPAPRVTDLSYEIMHGSANLSFTWSRPQADESREAAGYYLYKSVDGGEFVKAVDDLITDTTCTLTQEQYDRTKGIVFAVTAVTAHEYPTGEPYYEEGIFSNHCIYNGNLNGRSAYEIAVDEGFNGTLEEWLESIKGVSVETIEKTGTSGLVDTYTITFSDGSTDTFHVTNGERGDDGLSAYQVAKANGYAGTEEQWLALIGADCASGHSYTEFTLPAACGVPGVTLKVCAKCGSSAFTAVAALSHAYTKTVIPPTCHSKGYSMYKCGHCDSFYLDDFTDPTDHIYKTKVVKSTCVSDGFTIRYCEDCGYMQFVDETAASGHDYRVTQIVEPTCTTKGYSVYSCSVCGVSYSADETPTVAHKFDAQVISATCKTEGFTIYTCSSCGYAQIGDRTPVTEHTSGEWICEDPGAGRYVIRCTACNTVLETKVVTLNPETSGLAENPAFDPNGVLIVSPDKPVSVHIRESATNGNPVIYTTSDPNVVMVDGEGNVTVTGFGEAVITVRVSGTDIEMQIPVKVDMTLWQRIVFQFKKAIRVLLTGVFGAKAAAYILDRIG